MAAGLLTPNSGSVIVLGNEISEMSEKELLPFRRKIGFVFQEGALFDSMSVGENVAYRLREDRVAEEEIEPRVLEVLIYRAGTHRRYASFRAVGGDEAARFDCQGADQPAAYHALRFTDRGTRPGDVADDYYVDFAAARCVWSDGVACDPSIARRFCAGEFSFRSSDEAGGSQRAKWKCRGSGERGENAVPGLQRRRDLFRGRTGREIGRAHV